MRNIIKLSFMMILSLVASPVYAATSWRCGTKMVNVGNTKAEVIAQCGESTARDFVAYNKKNSNDGVRQETQVEEFVYVVSDRVSYILSFEKGRLIEINSQFRN